MLVAPRPARFLVISLQAFGHIFMDHKTHIRLINPHPKGVGGHDDAGMVRSSSFPALPSAAPWSSPAW